MFLSDEEREEVKNFFRLKMNGVTREKLIRQKNLYYATNSCCRKNKK